MSLPLSTPNWMDWNDAGAPQINNVAGSGLAAIMAFCVTGFNIKSVSSIVVLSGVATVTCATHGFSADYGKLVKLSGVGVVGLDGVQRIGDVTTNTFTYPANGVADGTYTGTIEARRAGLGWEVAYINGASTVAILRRTAAEANTQLLRIDDTDAREMRVVMVESATDVDTYANPAPTAALLSGGQYWHKGPNTATSKRYALVGNDRALFPLMPGSSTVDYSNVPMFFGDGVAYFAGDSHFTLLNGSISALGTPSSQVGRWGALSSNFVKNRSSVVARSRDGVVMGPDYGGFGPAGGGGQIGGSGSGSLTYSKVVVHQPVWLIDSLTDREIRGEYPGLAAPLVDTPFLADGSFAVKADVVGGGRVFLSALVQAASTSASNIMFDLTGPWYPE